MSYRLLRLAVWVVPGGLLVAAAGGAPRLAPPAWTQALAHPYPWLALGAAFLLAVLFHRSRLAGAALVVAAAYPWLAVDVPGSRVGPAGTAAVLFLGLLSLTRDRGLRAPLGLAQLAAATAAAGAVAFLCWEAPQDVVAILTARPLSWWPWDGLGVGQVPALAYLGALVSAAAAAVRWRGAPERGLLWAVPALILADVAATGGGGLAGASPGAVAGGGDAGASSLFVLAAGLTLALSVLETSYAMAYRDDLTGLPARRALMRDMDALGSTYTVAMVDVDHFKKFNDRHGHDVGDQVLKMVAGRLARVGGGGRAYRYGGEEFTILFPGLTREEALDALEALRASVEEASFAVRGRRRPRKKPPAPGSAVRRSPGSKQNAPKRLSVTVSVGVADSSAAGSSPESVLKRADRALYRAKKAGRNRVSK